jgi:D-alanyl-D-alanine carboxypeptidase
MLPIVLLMAAISPQFAQKMRETTWRAGCPVPIEDLRQVTVDYWNFDRKPSKGRLIVHQGVAEEIAAIFKDLYRRRFPIERITPVEEYNGNDDASMAANNTSAFNCRDVTGRPGTYSNHSWGRAIDINPLTNPYVKGDKVFPPEGRRYLDRNQNLPGLIRGDSFVVQRFLKAGWRWGGNWSDLKDYQHFEKPI